MPEIIEPEKKETPLLTKVRQFVTLKRQIDDLTKEQAVVKSYLSELVDNEGQEDDKGHRWIVLDQEVDGYKSLQRVRRVSQRLDEEVALQMLKEKGLDSRCFEMKPVIKEDEVMACLYEGLLSEEDVDKLYPKTIVWAFQPSKTVGV